MFRVPPISFLQCFEDWALHLCCLNAKSVVHLRLCWCQVCLDLLSREQSRTAKLKCSSYCCNEPLKPQLECWVLSQNAQHILIPSHQNTNATRHRKPTPSPLASVWDPHSLPALKPFKQVTKHFGDILQVSPLHTDLLRLLYTTVPWIDGFTLEYVYGRWRETRPRLQTFLAMRRQRKLSKPNSLR